MKPLLSAAPVILIAAGIAMHGPSAQAASSEIACPTGKIPPYVFLCADGPGKCPGTLAYETICTTPSERGFGIHRMSSRIQLQAAEKKLQDLYAEWKINDELASHERVARATYVGVQMAAARALSDQGNNGAAE